jgi:hypothetical protein
MLASEATLTGVLAVAVMIVLRLALPKLAAVAFDPPFAAASGLSVSRLDLLVTALSLACVIIGLRIVGLVLVVALLIIPPAAARFWSDRLGVVVTIAALFGAVSAYVGAALSAVLPDVPTGAVIVLCAAALVCAPAVPAFAQSFVSSSLIGEMATRFAGSADIFAARRRPVSRSINFITAHDGVTLADLVSHTAKHNEENGEDNRDGTDANLSWNHGAEGPSGDPAINAARAAAKVRRMNSASAGTQPPEPNMGSTMTAANDSPCSAMTRSVPSASLYGASTTS